MKNVLFKSSITVIGLGLLLFLALGSTESEKQKSAQVERIKEQPISDITWREIDNIYDVQSKFSDLQKKEHWKNYKGKKVKWTGKVSSVSETFGTLTLQIKMNSTTLTSDVLIWLKDSEKQKALKIKLNV